MSDTRRHVHELIDRLPPEQLADVAGLLESLLDGEISLAEESGVEEEARKWLRSNGGRGIPHADVLADFGLTVDEFYQMGAERARSRQR